MKFGVVIPCGHHHSERERCADLLESLNYYESDSSAEILVVDDSHDNHRSPTFVSKSSHNITVIQNPRCGLGNGWSDGLSAGVAEALRILAGHPLAFVLRLDTDSLIINPFAHAIQAHIRACSDVGLLGTYHYFPNGDRRIKDANSVTLRRMMHWFSPLPRRGSERRHWHNGLWGRGAVRRRLITNAVRNGYHLGTYCQGGGYAITANLMTRISACRVFDDPLFLIDTGIGEDVMMTLVSYRCGLRAIDFNGEGEVFGVINTGLAYPPEVLVTRGYSIIHSLKGFHEDAYRRYFRARRA